MAKGQIAVLDLVVSVVVFLIVMTGFFIAWNSYNNRLDDSLLSNEMSLHAFQIMQQLITTPGVPGNWENNVSSLKFIGLAYSDRIIDEAKLDSLNTINYNDLKNKMNIKRFEVFILVKQGNQAVYEIGNTTKGKTIHIERGVMYKNEPSTIQVALSKK